MAAPIDPALIQRLQTRLDLSRAAVYRLIEKTVNAFHLERRLAAILLASQNGVNIAKFATSDDLAAIRQATSPGAATKVSPLQPAQPPVSPAKQAWRTRRHRAKRQRGTSVWVVHGRDQKAAEELRRFLRALGLQPLEWNQALARTGQGSPYVGAVLERAFRDAAAVVVLLTPDDEARLRVPYHKGAPASERRLTGQARPNVLFEAGMAFGRDPNSTVLVQVGYVRPFSDIAGRHVVHLDNTPERRNELATKLANAGCDVDLRGMDWLREGNFSLDEGVSRKKRGGRSKRRRSSRRGR